MIQQLNPKRDREIKEFYETWWSLHTPPLVLTNKDEISVEELWVKDACPFWVKEGMRKLGLKKTQKVFFKREGGQWAFSLRKG